MTPGERAELVARPSHAWGARNDAPPGWDAARGTRFVLDLLSFDAPVRDYDAQPCDRLARAGELRAQGNAVWAAGGARGGPRGRQVGRVRARAGQRAGFLRG